MSETSIKTVNEILASFYLQGVDQISHRLIRRYKDKVSTELLEKYEKLTKKGMSILTEMLVKQLNSPENNGRRFKWNRYAR